MVMRQHSGTDSRARRWGAEVVLPALLFATLMAVFATGAAWKHADTQERAQAELQRLVDRVGVEVSHRLQHVVYGLRSTGGFLANGLVADPRAFRSVVGTLDLREQFAGVLGLGVLQLALRNTGLPDQGDFSLIYLEPDEQRQAMVQALTLEPGLLLAAHRAVATGQPQLSARMGVTRESWQEPTVLLFVPSPGVGASAGLVLARIDMHELLGGMPDVSMGLLEIVVQDITAGAATPLATFIATQHGAVSLASTGGARVQRHARAVSLPMLGRNLELHAHSTEAFDAMFVDRSPWFVLGAGLLIAAMLSLYVRNRLGQHFTLAEMVEQRTRELEHQRLRLRTILETATDGIHLLNTDGLLVEANPAFLRMLGLEATAVGKAHVTDWDAGSRVINADVLHELRDAPTGTVIETQNRQRGGGLIDVEVSVCGLDIDGEALLYCASRDVTDRNRTRAALQRSEEFKKGILDSIPDAIVVVNDAGIVVAGNLAWRKSIEQDAQTDAEGQVVVAPLGAPYRLACRAANAVVNADIGIHAVLAGVRTGYSLRYQCLQPRRQRWLRLSVTPMTHGGRRHAVIVHQDITQQRHLEQERFKAQALLQNVSNRAPGMLYEYRLQPDGSSSFSFASDGIQELYQVSAQQARADARAVFETIVPEDREQVVASLRSSAFDLTPRTHEYRVRHADGQVRWLMDNSLAQVGSDGRTLWHGFVTDVTERKRAEMELISYQTKLKEMVAEGVQRVQTLSMELASAEARERRELSEDLHDNLGQGLALIRFRLKSLTARDDGAEEEGGVQQQLREIATQVEHAIQSVRTLTAQLWPPVLYRFGLGPALEWLSGEMESHYGLRVILRIEPLPPLDEVTGIFLFRAVRELLINVWKHAQVSQAELAAALDGRSQALVLRVSDQGVGFDAALAQDPLANKFGLFSLGERIRLIGGNVHIESNVGRGTTVTIRLDPGASKP